MRKSLAALSTLALVTAGAVLLAGSPAYAVPVSDDFNRADGTDLGAGWIEIGTDLAIASNRLVNPSATSSMAIAVGGTGNRVQADVAAGGPGNLQYAALVLAYSSNNELVFVKVQDSEGDGTYDHIVVMSGNNSGTVFGNREISPFSVGTLQATLGGQQLTVTVNNVSITGPFDLGSVSTFTGVGVGLSGGSSIDNFVSSDVVAPQSVSFTTIPPSPAQVGTDAAVAAAASSGLPVTISSTTPGTCTTDGATVHYLGLGTCTLEAAQAGSSTVAPDSATQSVAVVKAKPEVVAAYTPETAYYGDTISATALLTFPAAYQAGTVQFSLDGVPTDSPVPTEEFPPRADLQLLATPHAGTHTLGAAYTPDDPATTDDASGSTNLTVLRAPTQTDVVISAGVATAAVSGGATFPTGNVLFTVNGVGTTVVALSSGQAVLPTAVQRGDTVTAIYAGSFDYLPSADSTALSVPIISASVSGSRSASGWYSGPVTVSFACTQHYAQLTEPCPGPVSVTGEGVQTVTRTIHDVEGGVATTSVQVNVDRTGPVVRVAGLGSKAPYLGDPSSRARCAVTDSLSGVESCTISSSPAGKGRVAVTASAVDRAGNTSTATARVATASAVVIGAGFRKGRWVLRRGASVTLLALGMRRPVLVGFPGQPPMSFYPAGKVDGRKQWMLGLTVPSSAKTGVRAFQVQTGGTTYRLPVAIR